MTKILSHFSTEPFKLDPNFKERFNDEMKLKPHGMWLSDESDYGWKEWCEKEKFRLEHLAYRTDYEIDLSDILFLSSDQHIRVFSEKYRYKNPSSYIERLKFIDWDKVYEEYKGILISPYSWNLRLEYMWYYGFDCASACVWDVSVLKELGCQKV